MVCGKKCLGMGTFSSGSVTQVIMKGNHSPLSPEIIATDLGQRDSLSMLSLCLRFWGGFSFACFGSKHSRLGVKPLT